MNVTILEVIANHFKLRVNQKVHRTTDGTNGTIRSFKAYPSRIDGVYVSVIIHMENGSVHEGDPCEWRPGWKSHKEVRR